jgi:hypothetical protein
MLWIDAICIIQADSEERGTQIRIMDVIYQSAQDTVIWLGEPWTPEVDEVMRKWFEISLPHQDPTFASSDVETAVAAPLLRALLAFS